MVTGTVVGSVTMNSLALEVISAVSLLLEIVGEIEDYKKILK